MSKESPTRPEVFTNPYSKFFDYHKQTADFFIFFVRWTQRPDEMYRDVLEILYREETDASRKEEYKRYMEEPRWAVTHFKTFARFVIEMMLVRDTDNFLTYISELLALIFISRPETLKSGEMVRVDEVLQHGTMDELIKRLAERRVERLSYQGMEDLQKDLTEKLNFDMFPSSENLSRAVRIIEMRNLIVHNRGIVNRVFQTRTGTTSPEIGQPIELSPKSVVSDLDFLAESVIEIDKRAALKFRLVCTGMGK